MNFRPTVLAALIGTVLSVANSASHAAGPIASRMGRPVIAPRFNVVR